MTFIWLKTRTAEAALWWTSDRCDKAANKAEAIEQRQMITHLRLHEYVRHLMMIVEGFNERADPAWLVRQLRDLTCSYHEKCVRDYHDFAGIGDVGRMVSFAFSVMWLRLAQGECQRELEFLRRVRQYEFQTLEVPRSTCKLLEPYLRPPGLAGISDFLVYPGLDLVTLGWSRLPRSGRDPYSNRFDLSSTLNRP